MGLVIALLLTAKAFAGSNPIPTGSVLFFAHFANGAVADGSGTWKTDFNFVNNSSSLTNGQLQLFNDSGAPFTLGTTMGTGSSFTFSIPAQGSLDIVTEGSGSVAGGWASATFDQTVSGSAIYSLFNADGQVVSVAVLGGFPKTTFASPVNGGDGIAIANVDQINPGTSTVTVTLTDATGIFAGSAVRTIASGHHFAFNLVQVIPGTSPSFTGSIKIQSSGPKIQAIVLGVKPNARLYVAYPQPAISYNTLATSYSGRFSVDFGPSAPEVGTAKISNIRYLNSSSILADFEVDLGLNTYKASGIVTVDDFGIIYSLFVQLPGLLQPAQALFILTPPGVPAGGCIAPGALVGFVANLGNGDFGSFTLCPA
jgi:hypothetical protein